MTGQLSQDAHSLAADAAKTIKVVLGRVAGDVLDVARDAAQKTGADERDGAT